MIPKFKQLATTKVIPSSCSEAPKAGRRFAPRCWGTETKVLCGICQPHDRERSGCMSSSLLTGPDWEGRLTPPEGACCVHGVG